MQAKIQKLDAQFKEDAPKGPQDGSFYFLIFSFYACVFNSVQEVRWCGQAAL